MRCVNSRRQGGCQSQSPLLLLPSFLTMLNKWILSFSVLLFYWSDSHSLLKLTRTKWTSSICGRFMWQLQLFQESEALWQQHHRVRTPSQPECPTDFCLATAGDPLYKYCGGPRWVLYVCGYGVIGKWSLSSGVCCLLKLWDTLRGHYWQNDQLQHND